MDTFRVRLSHPPLGMQSLPLPFFDSPLFVRKAALSLRHSRRHTSHVCSLPPPLIPPLVLPEVAVSLRHSCFVCTCSLPFPTAVSPACLVLPDTSSQTFLWLFSRLDVSLLAVAPPFLKTCVNVLTRSSLASPSPLLH